MNTIDPFEAEILEALRPVQSLIIRRPQSRTTIIRGVIAYAVGVAWVMGIDVDAIVAEARTELRITSPRVPS